MSLQIERIMLCAERNVSLTAMIQSVDGEFVNITARPAILILPGGGYEFCSDREAEVVAYPYLEAGFHAFVLRYSVAQHKTWPNPLNDYEAAMRLIRLNAEAWHIAADKIAVIGFSAGGHLAACAAALSENRPSAAILGYAATGKRLTDFMHTESAAPAPCEHVDAKTCPCFLFTARDDTLVPVSNTIAFEQELMKYGIMFESHVYACGGHGFATGARSITDAPTCSRVPRWVSDSIDWLGDLFGVLTPRGFTEPLFGAKISGDFEQYLSAKCTLGFLKKHGVASPLLTDVFKAMKAAYPNADDENALISIILDSVPLNQLMEKLGMGDERIAAVDNALRLMPNRFWGEPALIDI